MRVCSIHGSLDESLRQLGHEVLSLRPPPGSCGLPELLEGEGFAPDLILQQETLGPRTLLDGLDHFDCPRIFWSIDTHLNSFWQVHYGRLFDLVLTTQKSWAGKLAGLGLPDVDWLPWFGFEHPWSPWGKRSRDVCFVGRVTSHRPVRRAFVSFLTREFDAVIRQDLSFQDMVEFYADSRLAPNESILGEVNFRTFEAASCGCAVINPDLGEDLEALFDKGREMLVYGHALELREALAYGLRHPGRMQRMAAAARERIHSEHLPLHRAAGVLERAAGCSRKGAAGQRAVAGGLLARFELWQAARMPLDPAQMLKDLLADALVPQTCAAVISLLWQLKAEEQLVSLLGQILSRKQYEEAWEVNLAGSMALLTMDSFGLARQFWYRQARDRDDRHQAVGSPLDLYLAWAAELKRSGRDHRPGFIFDAKRHLPASSLECLLAAHVRWPGELRVQRRMNGLLASLRGTEQTRLALLSSLTLHERGNWRDGLELAMVNLRIFRIRQGLEETAAALEEARHKGDEKRFFRLLGAMDPGGTIMQTLSLSNPH